MRLTSGIPPVSYPPEAALDRFDRLLKGVCPKQERGTREQASMGSPQATDQRASRGVL